METAHRTDRRETPARPLALRLYLAGAVALGVSALAGGVGLVSDPTGSRLGLPLAWLEGSPFVDYLVPGLVLFGVFGVGSFVVVYAVVRRLRWAWVAAVGLGLTHLVWILVELAIIQSFHPLHVVYGGLAIVLVALALRPSVRAALRAPPTDTSEGPR